MSDETPVGVDKLKREVNNARRKRNANLLIASIWSVSAVTTWFSVIVGNHWSLPGGIAATGIAVMYWMFSIGASLEYSSATQKLARHPK